MNASATARERWPRARTPYSNANSNARVYASAVCLLASKPPRATPSSSMRPSPSPFLFNMPSGLYVFWCCFVLYILSHLAHRVRSEFGARVRSRRPDGGSHPDQRSATSTRSTTAHRRARHPRKQSPNPRTKTPDTISTPTPRYMLPSHPGCVVCVGGGR